MKVGDTYTLKHTVAENETAEILGSGGLPVYSTPSMICLMELTSYKLAEQFGHQTVGTKVNISHIKACKVGTEVTATAEVLEFEGRRILYKVSVSDEKGLMGEGTHERFIIDPERFMAKLG
ncbi:MAG: thioesterase family protein [Bacteroidales bacterium]|nr:thioesterase family protein [Bacteroidales bacterium]